MRCGVIYGWWLPLGFMSLAGCADSSTTLTGQAAAKTAHSVEDVDDGRADQATSGGQRAAWPQGALIDLTHPFDKTTIYWPTAAGFELQREKYGVSERGYFYAANRFQAAEHGGTHLDAPIHFYEGRDTVDQISLERLLGEGVLVDVRMQCSRERDYQISVKDLRAWEESRGQTLAERIVLLYTGYCQHWPDRQKYLGTAHRGEEAVAELHFPGLHPDAARWLAEHRAVKAVGIDTASIDYGQSRLFQSHVTLFENNVPVFENVAALDRLPSRFVVIALPMKIAGGSGGPLRIVAVGTP